MITENMFLNTHYVLLIFHAIFDMQQNDIKKDNPPPPPQPSTLCLITRHQVLGFLRRPHPPTLTPHPPSPSANTAEDNNQEEQSMPGKQLSKRQVFDTCHFTSQKIHQPPLRN